MPRCLTGKRVFWDLAAKWPGKTMFRGVLQILVARDGGWFCVCMLSGFGLSCVGGFARGVFRVDGSCAWWVQGGAVKCLA
jgi:hypothetical protein